MLRGGDAAENITAFCARCHTDGDTQSAAGMHWLAVGSAHIYSEKDTRHFGGGLDRGSKRCLGCHDGVNASDAGTSGRTHGTARYWDQRRNHPVGVPYPTSGQHRSGSSYTPAALIPDHVRLPNGQVGCVSCHDLYAQRDDLLTMSNRGSALCLTCHAME